jgi:hypothetical protein
MRTEIDDKNTFSNPIATASCNGDATQKGIYYMYKNIHYYYSMNTHAFILDEVEKLRRKCFARQ